MLVFQDFIVSVVFTVLWFIASTAWADNLTKMTQYMNPENLIKELSACDPKGQCKPGRSGDMSTLIVSVVCMQQEIHLLYMKNKGMINLQGIDRSTIFPSRMTL